MFYNDKDCAYRIIYVYRQNDSLPSEDLNNPPRSYSALAYRMTGNTVFQTDTDSIRVGDDCINYIPSGLGFSRSSASESKIILHMKHYGREPESIQLVRRAAAQKHYFDEILDCWQKKENGYENRCNAFLYAMFADLEYSALCADPKASLIAPGAAMIREQFTRQNFTIGEAAYACHISETYFRRLWQEIYGMSPVKSLISLRMEHAKTLLKTKNCSVTETAALSGFSDVKYFSASFRRTVGMTPSDFMKR